MLAVMFKSVAVDKKRDHILGCIRSFYIGHYCVTYGISHLFFD